MFLQLINFPVWICYNIRIYIFKQKWHSVHKVYCGKVVLLYYLRHALNVGICFKRGRSDMTHFPVLLIETEIYLAKIKRLFIIIHNYFVVVLSNRQIDKEQNHGANKGFCSFFVCIFYLI